MEINIHPAARTALDREAARILHLAQDIFDTRATPAENYLIVNGYPLPVDIGWRAEAVVGGRNRSTTAVGFAVSGKMIHFDGDDFLKFSQFAEKVQARTELSQIVSVSATQHALARWLQRSVNGESSSFIDEYLQWVEENVGEQTIIFPIYDLVFDGEWGVNGVTVRNLTFEELRGLFEREMNAAETPDKNARFNEWKDKIGNRAAAFVPVVAEPIRAEEIAFAKVDQVLSILRSYSPAMLTPEGRSFCTIYGMEHTETRTSILVPPVGRVHLKEESLGGGTRWHLTESKLQQLADLGLLQTCALLEAEPRTEFQTRVAKATELYSRAALEHRLESKLLFILSAIEHLLLRSDGEPVAANLARRFAYYVGDSLEARRAIQQRLRDVYTLRSNFVHHGRSIENVLLVEAFLKDAWTFFRLLAFDATKFLDKATFLNTMEDEMLAGPTLPVTEDGH